MYDDDYGMCCSEEMANQCARDYEAWVNEENRKGLVGIALFIAALIAAFIFLLIIFA